jgi:hypothetical protein
MTKELLGMIAVLMLVAFCTSELFAQISRASVPASEVNGTFRYNFTGKYRGSSSEIKILALGKGKLKVAFDLVYPYTTGTGELMANIGQAAGIATITGDTAVYKSNEFGECTITIKFVKPGTISVDQEGASSCGFGHNVMAAGKYTRVSKLKPTFESKF